MVLKKTSIYIFLLGMTLLGAINSQRITIPLKKSIANELLVTVKYGLDQCEINLNPSTTYCSNTISQVVQDPGHCGSSFVGNNYSGNQYAAPFQLGDTKAELIFTVPFEGSLSNGEYSLCLGIESINSNNALDELFFRKQITNRVAYFYLNSANSSSNDENGVVGTLAIGEPIQSLSKGKFSTLKKGNNEDVFSAASPRYIYAFGQRLDSRETVFIDTNSPFSQFPYQAYQQLLDIITKKGIKYTQVKGAFQTQTYFESIDQLEPIIFTLLQEDKASTFNVSLSPSQYTTKLADGTFQLLINLVYYTESITIGNTILESYNFGYDLENQRILIAHKSEQNNNFRGTHIKL